jgi:hypothetical protein
MGRRRIFRELLSACRASGVEFVRLEDEARRILSARQSVPVCDQVMAPIDGRSGLVATQSAA